LRGQDISDGLLDDVKAELPDLILPDPPDRYLIAYKGEKIVIPIAVKNSSGSGAAASFLSVRCNEKGVQSEQLLAVPPLDQGEQITLNVEYVPQSEWDILCDVSIDPDMSIPELNENNNSNRFTLQVWTKSLPDLVPSLTYSLMSARKLRWNITVRNIGEKESESIEYLTSLICRKGSSVLQQSDVPAQLPKIPALPPGKSYIFNSSSKVEGDLCTFTIKVDALDKMPESNEGNNIAEVTIRLK
jgi:subtilase family serine protease